MGRLMVASKEEMEKSGVPKWASRASWPAHSAFAAGVQAWA